MEWQNAPYNEIRAIVGTDRVLPGKEAQSSGSMDTLNVIFIVGIALLITLLARHFSGRNGRKK